MSQRSLLASSACVFAAMVSAALFIIALCAPPPVNAQAKAPEFLFVQTAKNIAYRDGVLTLQDISPVTVFFSDRPKRIVGHVRNDLFFKKWTEGNNSFKSDPPNAVLSVLSGNTPPTETVVVLNNPRVDGKTVSYDVQTLKGALPASGVDGTLFIDGSSGYCDPGYDIGDSGYPCWAQKAFAGDAP
jgi:hypothetical protein